MKTEVLYYRTNISGMQLAYPVHLKLEGDNFYYYQRLENKMHPVLADGQHFYIKDTIPIKLMKYEE